MGKVKLGDIFEIGSGGTPSKRKPEYYQGNIPWVKTGDLKKKYLYEVEGFISKEGLDNSSAKMYDEDTVLIAMYGATIGATSILKTRACTNQACAAFKPNEKVLPEYLYYFLKSRKERFISDGVGGAQPNISSGYLKKVEIEIPTIIRQKEIIKILDDIYDIIEKRKQELIQLDNLIQSRFVEMFGDPIRNTQNRPTTKLINVVKMQRGFDLPVQDRNQDGNIPVYGANGVLDSHNTARIHGGGVITGRSGTIGKVFYTEGDYWPLNTSLFSVDKHGNNVIYLAYLLQMFDLTRFVEGTGVPTLNRNMFHNRQIIDVSINEQNQFAAFVNQVNKSKFVIHKFLYCTTHNTKSIIKPRPNTKESGKIRGGKPHADEF